MTITKGLTLIVLGFAGGLFVGTGLVAFLTVLGIVPRLTQLTKSYKYIFLYEYMIILGSLVWTWTDFGDHYFQFNHVFAGAYGMFAGIFVGMLAAALTEVLNVLPILAKRIHLVEKILWLLMAMVIGKVLGSLFQWIYFTPFSLG